jgi:hypothetical protein
VHSPGARTQAQRSRAAPTTRRRGAQRCAGAAGRVAAPHGGAASPAGGRATAARVQRPRAGRALRPVPADRAPLLAAGRLGRGPPTRGHKALPARGRGPGGVGTLLAQQRVRAAFPARGRAAPAQALRLGVVMRPACLLAPSVVAVHLDTGKQKSACLERRSGRNVH